MGFEGGGRDTAVEAGETVAGWGGRRRWLGGAGDRAVVSNMFWY